jgi:hypothetical protein
MKIKFGIILFGAVLIFFSCKKYPENNLWFKSPNNAMIGKWKLELFSVNGTDSTSYDDLKMYTEEGIELLDEDIRFLEQYEGGWKLDNKKKNVTINSEYYGGGKLYVPQKNLFRDNQTWKIEKLNKSSFWLSVTNAGSSYLVKLKH